jgi:hypothetical protein
LRPDVFARFIEMPLKLIDDERSFGIVVIKALETRRRGSWSGKTLVNKSGISRRPRNPSRWEPISWRGDRLLRSLRIDGIEKALGRDSDTRKRTTNRPTRFDHSTRPPGRFITTMRERTPPCAFSCPSIPRRLSCPADQPDAPARDLRPCHKWLTVTLAGASGSCGTSRSMRWRLVRSLRISPGARALMASDRSRTDAQRRPVEDNHADP